MMTNGFVTTSNTAKTLVCCCCCWIYLVSEDWRAAIHLGVPCACCTAQSKISTKTQLYTRVQKLPSYDREMTAERPRKSELHTRQIGMGYSTSLRTPDFFSESYSSISVISVIMTLRDECYTSLTF